MKIAFYTSAGENIGVGQLVAALKNNGHAVRLFCDPLLFNDSLLVVKSMFLFSEFITKKIIKRIILFKPDLLAISCTSMDWKRSLAVAEKVKEVLDIPIVAGGIHASLHPESFISNKNIDFVFQGEADISFPLFIKKLSQRESTKDICGIWYKSGDGRIYKGPDPVFPDNLDALPWPDKEAWGWPVTRLPEYRIQTSRDCPFLCSFCCMHYKLKDNEKLNRRRSPENVIDELEQRYLQYKFKYVHFYDAVFPNDKKWLNIFSAYYKKKIALPFSCQGHPAVLDRETIFTLKEMNCQEITIGVQTLNESVRRKWLNRRYSNLMIKKVFDSCEKAGLKFNVDHIVDLPESSIEDLLTASRQYACYRNLIRFKSYHLHIFPGTELFSKMNQAGLLSGDVLSDISKGIYDTYGKSQVETRRFGNYMESYPVFPHAIKKNYPGMAGNRALSALFTLLFFPSQVLNMFRQDYPSYQIYLQDRVLSFFYNFKN